MKRTIGALVAAFVLIVGMFAFAGSASAGPQYWAYGAQVTQHGSGITYNGAAWIAQPYSGWRLDWGNDYIIFQTDGNFVGYRKDNGKVWYNSQTAGVGAEIWFQNDGNVVVYHGTGPTHTALWASNTIEGCCGTVINPFRIQVQGDNFYMDYYGLVLNRGPVHWNLDQRFCSGLTACPGQRT